MGYHLFEKFLRDALMFWATVDPIGTLSIFAGLTAGMAAGERRRIALRANVYATIILVLSAVLGQIILDAMEIQLASLQVAGGIILLMFGLQMVFGSLSGTLHGQAEAGHDMAVFPLAVPSIASPGAIMAAIILTDNDLFTIPVQAGTLCVLLAVLVVNYLLMLAAGPILKIIGQSGASILIRIMGILLAALSVQIVMGALQVRGWTP
jgi:multiple antibiotic resistance protein